MADSALSSSTFSNLGGAVSDLFAGIGAKTAGSLKRQGMDIEAAGTDLSAQSLRLKAAGDLAEGQEYGLAADLARKNAAYTETSTAIQQTQLDRQITQTIGSQQAAAASNGLKASGSALYLLADSAQQGALAKHTLEMQGHITEEGYQEQAASYDLMSSTARSTAAGEQDIAGKTEGIANMQRQLGVDTENAANQAASGSFISAALKGVAALAPLANFVIPGAGTVISVAAEGGKAAMAAGGE